MATDNIKNKRTEEKPSNVQKTHDTSSSTGNDRKRQEDDNGGTTADVTQVISMSAGGRRSSGGVKTSSIHSSSLTTLLLLKKLADVIRSHNLSENRWHDFRGHMISFLKCEFHGFKIENFPTMHCRLTNQQPCDALCLCVYVCVLVLTHFSFCCKSLQEVFQFALHVVVS